MERQSRENIYIFLLKKKTQRDLTFFLPTGK